MKKFKKWIHNLKIIYKIILATFSLVVVFLTYSILLGINIFKDFNNSKKSILIIELSTKTAQVIHYLQRERGASSGFISSNGKNFKDILLNNRKGTDDSLNTLLEYIKKNQIGNQEIQKKLNFINEKQKELLEIRNKVNELSISFEKSFEFYTNFIEYLLFLTKELDQNITNIMLYRLLDTYHQFTFIKENAGRERALLSSAFSKKEIDDNTYVRFINTITLQEYLKNKLLNSNLKEFIEIYNKNIDKPLQEEVEFYRKKAITKNYENINSEIWFQTSTKRIDNLTIIQNEFEKNILDKAKEIYINNLLYLIGIIFIDIILILIMIIIIITIYKSIHHSVSFLKNIVKKIEEGDLSIPNVEETTNDELGNITQMVYNLANHIKEMIQKIKNYADLIVNASNNLLINSKNISEISKNIGSFSQHLSSSSEEMTNNLNIIASSTEEITITLNEVSKNSSLVQQKSNEVYEIVKQASQHILSLNEKSKNIEKITEIISDIAKQINLLALNAAIEAASAGDKGAGFTVVANEVKELANRTHQELKSIKDNINILQTNVLETNTIMQKIDDNFAELNKNNQTVISSFYEQTTAIKEISNNINQNLSAVDDINKRINQLEDMLKEEEKQIEEINKLTEDYKKIANELIKILSFYKNY